MVNKRLVSDRVIEDVPLAVEGRKATNRDENSHRANGTFSFLPTVSPSNLNSSLFNLGRVACGL